jgi:hypothetical protein
MRHHFSRLMASLIDLSRKAHSRRPHPHFRRSLLPSLSPRQERRKADCNSSIFWNLGLDSTFSTIPHGIVKLNTILLGLITVSPKPVSITISIFFEFWQTWRICFSENEKKAG